MKEEKYYLDTPQTEWLKTVLDKIQKIQFVPTGEHSGHDEKISSRIKKILQASFYTTRDRVFLGTLRKEYITSFCI